MGRKRNDEIRTRNMISRGGVTCETIREAKSRCLRHVERKADEDVVLRTWMMEM